MLLILHVVSSYPNQTDESASEISKKTLLPVLVKRAAHDQPHGICCKYSRLSQGTGLVQLSLTKETVEIRYQLKGLTLPRLSEGVSQANVLTASAVLMAVAEQVDSSLRKLRELETVEILSEKEKIYDNDKPLTARYTVGEQLKASSCRMTVIGSAAQVVPLFRRNCWVYRCHPVEPLEWLGRRGFSDHFGWISGEPRTYSQICWRICIGFSVNR
ncbi:hypothetical protein T10_12902 [Trichinella papuae]|uniref:Uncharacterized protein n=1 Tax=Trichinella papuae TaxID=268474 RepID=A0A0V1NAD1_9BILA|nr:hypothetical protein T10_12902 [Trichinella papuae]